MNKTHEEKRHREAVLDGMRSVELGVMLREMGWEIGGRQNKANRRAAILHLEGYAVAGEIVGSLGLKRVERGAAAIADGGDGELNTDEGNTDGETVGIIRFDDGGQPIDRDEALEIVKRVAGKY